MKKLSVKTGQTWFTRNPNTVSCGTLDSSQFTFLCSEGIVKCKGYSESKGIYSYKTQQNNPNLYFLHYHFYCSDTVLLSEIV